MTSKQFDFWSPWLAFLEVAFCLVLMWLCGAFS